MMKMFGSMNYEMAFTSGIMVAALGDTSVETLIDAAMAQAHPGAVPMESVQTLGTTSSVYFDLNVSKILEFATAMAQEMNGNAGPLPMIAATVNGAAPVIGNVDMGDGKAQAKVIIPADLINKIGQAVMQLQQQQMQGGGMQ